AEVAQIRNKLANHEALSRVIDPQLEQLLLNVTLLEDEDKDALDQARTQKDKAEDALARFQFPEAAQQAWQGLDRLNEVQPASALPLYGDLAFILGQAKLFDRKPAEAALAFALVHRLQPMRRVDPARYLPEVVTAFDKAKPTPATVDVEV